MLFLHSVRYAVILSALLAVGQPTLAQTYTPLYAFTGGADGANPLSSLAYDEKGNLYGTTPQGNGVCGTYYGCGTVYKISPSGQETTLVSLTDAKGVEPQGPVTLVDHTLYGSAYFLGPRNYGTLFSVHTDGSRFQLLHSFSGVDGAGPQGPLIAGPQGVLYGITRSGGPGFYSFRGGDGVLFELRPDGTLIHLHDFTRHNGGADGKNPSTLAIDAAGTLYGSTENGSPCRQGCGVVFRYVRSTRSFTVLQQFGPPHYGIYPMVGSIGPDGTVYGATQDGGPRHGGTLFELVPTAGSYTYARLYGFGNQPHSGGGGYYPSGGPILTHYGALIGTTTEGNASLYKFASNHLSVLYNFPALAGPPPPTLDKNGTLYGATSGGGIEPCTVAGYLQPYGCGTIYSFLRAAP